jgi:hypothetical protein
VLHVAIGIVGASCGPRNEVAERFGLRGLPQNLENDLSRINGDPSWTVPMPGRYVIGTDAVVAYAEANPDYTRRPDPERLLVLSAMNSPLLTDRRRRVLRPNLVGRVRFLHADGL